MNRIDAANNALLVIYAWDMCNQGLRTIPPQSIDPRIANAGAEIVGYLSASDDIIRYGQNLRTSSIGASDSDCDRVCYGYVARMGDQYVVVLRGTDGAEEWGDDFDFLMTDHPTGGLVDLGFYSIYKTMQFHPATGGTPVAVVQGITAMVASASVMVLGHSLGAALGTYLSLDLKQAGCDTKACFFASPKTGNKAFVDFYDTTVGNYDVFNYEKDVVPTVPLADILHLSAYRTLPQAKVITEQQAQASIKDDIVCYHHLICYVAMLDSGTYKGAIADPCFANDDRNCALCIVNIK